MAGSGSITEGFMGGCPTYWCHTEVGNRRKTSSKANQVRYPGMLAQQRKGWLVHPAAIPRGTKTKSFLDHHSLEYDSGKVQPPRLTLLGVSCGARPLGIRLGNASSLTALSSPGTRWGYWSLLWGAEPQPNGNQMVRIG